MGMQWSAHPCPLPTLPCTFPPGMGNLPGQGLAQGAAQPSPPQLQNPC